MAIYLSVKRVRTMVKSGLRSFMTKGKKAMTKLLKGTFCDNLRMKTFTSVDKLSALLTGNDEYFNQLNETADPISP